MNFRDKLCSRRKNYIFSRLAITRRLKIKVHILKKSKQIRPNVCFFKNLSLRNKLRGKISLGDSEELFLELCDQDTSVPLLVLGIILHFTSQSFLLLLNGDTNSCHLLIRKVNWINEMIFIKCFVHLGR